MPNFSAGTDGLIIQPLSRQLGSAPFLAARLPPPALRALASILLAYQPARRTADALLGEF